LLGFRGEDMSIWSLTAIQSLVVLCALATAGTSFAGSPQDKQLVDLVKQLHAADSRGKARRDEIRDLHEKRKAWIRTHGLSKDAADDVEDGTWEGQVVPMLVDLTDASGNIIESREEYHLYSPDSSKRILFLDKVPPDLDNRHVRIKGIRVHDHVIPEKIEFLAPSAGGSETQKKINEPFVQTAGDIGGSSQFTSSACNTVGPQRALTIAVNWQDDTTASPAISTINDRYFGATNSLADFWNEASYGKTQLTGDTLGWFTLDMNRSEGCDNDRVRAKALAIAAQYTDLTQYNRFFIVLRNPDPSCGWAGKGELSCPTLTTADGQVTASTHWVLSSYFNNANTAVWLTAHEAGHNINIHHASVRDYGVSSIGPVGNTSGGTLIEYGDRYDSMGGYGSRPSHYNADHKHWVGWIGDNDIVDVNGSGNVTLEPISTPLTGKKAARIFRGVDRSLFKKEYLWLETRKPSGYDAFMDSRGHGSIIVHHQTASSANRSENIDLHPGTDTGTNDYFDAPLADGESFTDPYAGITITHGGVDAQGNVQALISQDSAQLDTDEDGIRNDNEPAFGTDPTLADTDSDGLTDLWEICYDADCDTFNTAADLNPLNPDTEGDGLLDGWEIEFGLNPQVDDASGDPDSDTLTNLQEQAAGSNPNLSDTDGDGLSDADEVNIYLTDPANPDSDNDGIPDGWEVENSLNPLSASDGQGDPDRDTLVNLEEYLNNSDPNVADTDGDGLTDAEEVNTYGTKPNNIDTDNDGLTDWEEIIVTGTSPFDSGGDTDDDGMSDQWENVRGTDVAVDDAMSDPDQDGVENILEYYRFSLPFDAGSLPAFRTLYVNVTDGSDYNDGLSPENAFSTIEAAITAAGRGDTIRVASGTYNVGNSFFRKPVRLVGPPDRSATLTAIYLNSFWNLRWGEISGFKVQVQFTHFVNNARNVRFHNCEIVVPMNGLNIGSNAKVTLENCIMKSGSSPAVRVANSQLNMVNSTIAGFSAGINLASTASLVIRNSILANTDDLTGDSSVVQASYSLISDGEFSGTNSNLTGDPGFVDPGVGNYHLLPSSIAIDSGDLVDPFDQEPENNGDRINMGAYGNTPEATTGNDSDGDGLTDQNEQCFDIDCGTYNPFDPVTNPTGTDMNLSSPDTDGDGFDDGLEIAEGSSPLDVASIPLSAKGDINADGVVDIADAVLANRIVLQRFGPTLNQRLRADVAANSSGAGVVDIADVLLIEQKILGKVVGF